MGKSGSGVRCLGAGTVVGVAALLALGLAGCAKTTPSKGVPPTTTTAAPTTLAPTTAAPTTAAPTTTAAAGAGAAPCTSSDLSVAATQSNGAAGTLTEMFTATNTSAAPCSMNGYPTTAPYGPQPQGETVVEGNLALTVVPIPSTEGAIGGPAQTVTLAAGHQAVFFIQWSDVPSGTTVCPDADGISFNTPTPSSYLLVTYSFEPCGTQIEQSVILPAGTSF